MASSVVPVIVSTTLTATPETEVNVDVSMKSNGRFPEFVSNEIVVAKFHKINWCVRK